jgi:hypothetical protein
MSHAKAISSQGYKQCEKPRAQDRKKSEYEVPVIVSHSSV